MTWLNITDDLTEKGKRELRVGQVLIFDYEGSKNYLKIVRKYKGKIWAKFINMYRPDEIKIVKR